MAEKKQKIVVKQGEVKVLCSHFNVTAPTVINALNYKYNSEMSKKIRKIALERGATHMREI